MNGTPYENGVHEFRKENETRYLKDSVAMNVSSSYPDLKLNVRKFGYRTVTNAITSLRNPPTPQPTGDYMKERVIEFMILVSEGGRFLPLGDVFHENFQIYKTVRLDTKFTDLIISWGRYSENARAVKKGSVLDKSDREIVKALGKKLFEDSDTKGVAGEELICMKCLKEGDFDIITGNPGVEPDEGPNAGQNPEHRGSADKPTSRGSGKKAKGSASGQGPAGSGSTQKPVGRKRPLDQIVCHFDAKRFCYQTGVEVDVAYDGGPRYNQLQSFEWGMGNLGKADGMLDIGFENQIRKIVELFNKPSPGRRQTILFSTAAFPTEIQRLASDFLSNYIFLSFERVGPSIGENALTSIFVETKRSADLLERWLRRMGFPNIAIHGDKVQTEREQALRSFKLGVTPILAAIDVASEVLDTPLVIHVIDFNLLHGIDSYVRRIGRTGLVGNFGSATAFFDDKNSFISKALSELMKAAHQEAPDWLNQYAESYAPLNEQRYGYSKFGGQQFRDENDNSYGTFDYGGALGGNDYYAKTVNVDYAGASDSHDYFASQPVTADFGGGSE